MKTERLELRLAIEAASGPVSTVSEQHATLPDPAGGPDDLLLLDYWDSWNAGALIQALKSDARKRGCAVLASEVPPDAGVVPEGRRYGVNYGPNPEGASDDEALAHAHVWNNAFGKRRVHGQDPDNGTENHVD